MKIKQSYEIYENLEEIDLSNLYQEIWLNIRKYRLQLYEQYKNEYKKRRGIDNPYSAENVADYLGFSENYYRKLETPSSSRKNITIKTLIKLMIIFGKRIDDFIDIDNLKK